MVGLTHAAGHLLAALQGVGSRGAGRAAVLSWILSASLSGVCLALWREQQGPDWFSILRSSAHAHDLRRGLVGSSLPSLLSQVPHITIPSHILPRARPAAAQREDEYFTQMDKPAPQLHGPRPCHQSHLHVHGPVSTSFFEP